MAKAFKPLVYYRNRGGIGVSVRVNTYTEVKKRMDMFMNDSSDNFIRVYRHRRGEWGEWFEHWTKTGGKNKIIKQGWQ
jgi:hypothetical protein